MNSPQHHIQHQCYNQSLSSNRYYYPASPMSSSNGSMKSSRGLDRPYLLPTPFSSSSSSDHQINTRIIYNLSRLPNATTTFPDPNHHHYSRETPRQQRKANRANTNILTSFHFARLMRISPPILPKTIAASQINFNLTLAEIGKFKLNHVYVYVKKSNSNRILTRSENNPRSILLNRSVHSSSSSSSHQCRSDQLLPFDYVFTSSDDDIASICSKILGPLLNSVVVHETPCTLVNLGAHNTHKSRIMIGRDDNHLTPGLIPSTISWFYRLIRLKAEALHQKYIVKVSFVEVSKNKLRDLLKHLSTRKDEKLRKVEDSTVNLVRDFMDNRTIMKASTSDQAAYLFDEAMRYRVNQWKSITDDESSTHFIFSLHLFRVSPTPDSSSSQELISHLNILDMGSDYNKLIVANCKQILRDPRKTNDLNILESTIHYYTTKFDSKVKSNTVLLGHVSDDGNEFSENIQVLKTLSKTYKRNVLINQPFNHQGKEEIITKPSIRPKLGQSSFSRLIDVVVPDDVEADVYGGSMASSWKPSVHLSVPSIFKLWRRQKSNSSTLSRPKTAWPNKSTVRMGRQAIMGKVASETWIDGPRSNEVPISTRHFPLLPNFSSNEDDRTETALSDISEKTERSFRNKLFGVLGRKKFIVSATREVNKDEFQPQSYSSPKMTRVVDWVNSIESSKKTQSRNSKVLNTDCLPTTKTCFPHDAKLKAESISMEVSKICQSLMTPTPSEFCYIPSEVGTRLPHPQNIIKVPVHSKTRTVVDETIPGKRKRKIGRVSSLFTLCFSGQPNVEIPPPVHFEAKSIEFNTRIDNNQIVSHNNRKSIVSGFAPSSGYDSMPGNDGSESEMSSFRIIKTNNPSNAINVHAMSSSNQWLAV